MLLRHTMCSTAIGHTTNLRAADAGLDEAVTAAAATASPNTSPVVYKRDDEDEAETLKAHMTALLQRLTEVTVVARKLILAVKTISEKEKKVAEAVDYATQMPLPAGNPAVHITAIVSVVAAATNLLATCAACDNDCAGLLRGGCCEGLYCHDVSWGYDEW